MDGEIHPGRPVLRFSMLMTVSAGALLLWPLGASVSSRDRREPPAELTGEAADALQQARIARSDTYAPLTFRWAEEAYSEGLMEVRRQEFRPGWMRDHERAVVELGEAIRWARQAQRIADGRDGRARGSAQAVLRRANAAVADLDRVEEQIWLSPRTRETLQTARHHAASAFSLLASGSYGSSASRAELATEAANEVRSVVAAATSRFMDRDDLATWAAWAEETVAWSARTGRAAVVVQKDEHRLTLYEAGRAVRTFRVELGWNNVGDKRTMGDGATPEGRYFITQKKGAGESRYHRALLIDYPNTEDVRALTDLVRAGAVPRGTRPGGLIEIHGSGGRGRDWTDGCVAVTNAEIEALFSRVSIGTPVTIVGGLTGAGTFSRIADRVSR